MSEIEVDGYIYDQLTEFKGLFGLELKNPPLLQQDCTITNKDTGDQFIAFSVKILDDYYCRHKFDGLVDVLFNSAR